MQPGFTSIQCLAIADNDCTISMKVFGALAGLLLVRTQYPHSLMPTFLKFIIARGDLHALTRSFVWDWFPSIEQRVTKWLQTGPTGDIQGFQDYFISYHNHPVCRYAFVVCSKLIYSVRLQFIALVLRLYTKNLLLGCCILWQSLKDLLIIVIFKLSCRDSIFHVQDSHSLRYV